MVLAKTWATVRARGVIHKAVAQLVLLYSSESCVVTGEMRKVLKGFHHQASRRITQMTAPCGAGG